MPRTTFSKFVLLSALWLAGLGSTGAVLASQLMFDITGNRMNYNSIVTVGGVQSSAAWSNTTRVFTAYAWVPGQLTGSLGPKKIWLTGPGLFPVPVPMDIKGLEYGGISGFDRVQAPDDVAGTLKPVGGMLANGAANQFSADMYRSQSGVPRTPFTLVRPLFTLDQSALVNAFAKVSESGTYRGMLPLSYAYRVQYQKDGIWTYEVRHFTLNIEVKFTARQLESVTVTGDGVFLNPEYATSHPEVRSETTFNVLATGMMPAGLRMSFKDYGRNYAMGGAGSETIPYSLTLMATGSGRPVNSPELIVAGKFNPAAGDNGEVVVLPTSDNTRITFDLKAGFTSGYVPPGSYSDQFVVMFDVVIE